MTKSLFSTIALVAAIACATLWAVDTLTIAANGAPDVSALDFPLFLTGAAACLVAVLAASLAVGAGRRTAWGRIVAGVLTFVGLVAVPIVIQLLAEIAATAAPSWIWGEVNLWVAAAVVLVLSIALYSRTHRDGAPVVAAAR